MWLNFVVGTLDQGLVYGIMVLGVYLSFRVLDYADLSVDGSFPLGAAIAARLIFDGYNPWLATFLALGGGALAGIFTGLLHTRIRITPLLSGILTMTALYSINLRIMGRSNIPLLRAETIFTRLTEWGVPESLTVTILGSMTVGVIIALLYLFLHTELGFALRATGDNEQMIKSMGVNVSVMKILGLALSNALVAFSGAYAAQAQRFADIGMGIGIIIAGLASVIIGEVLVGTSSILRVLVGVVFGSLVYRLVIAVVLYMGLKPTDLKLMTALLVIVALASPALKTRLRLNNIGR
ncbi:ABC transporter permease [Calderihabitans maritimus]|uniref:ABC transporter permease n=1 Tax=Calderihabitans maritimus TaxID=1246530 RepID=A0A1Z5HQV4_9FIRM|nr:ABC transporter permease [Calderihabitans maritimus]GAW91818.1 ABC transporter permease [Calderihabitans maritimus]